MAGRRPYKKRDPKITSSIMRAIRGRENRAEVSLRRALWRRGLRYRLYSSHLRGKPDIVFARARLAVFVDGDYWHGRALVEGGERALRQVIRGERFDWWKAKLERNVLRDIEVTRSLRRNGWRVIRVWESEVLRDVERIAVRIARRLDAAKVRR
jgi:DNA mismatch endonuclease, patch repair protein